MKKIIHFLHKFIFVSNGHYRLAIMGQLKVVEIFTSFWELCGSTFSQLVSEKNKLNCLHA